MLTLKIKYNASNEIKNIILDYQRNYSSCLHVLFNKRLKGVEETLCKHLKINNINLLDSWFIQSCVKEASQLVSVAERNKEQKLSSKEKLINKSQKKKLTKFEKRKLKHYKKISENSKPTYLFGGKQIFQDLQNGKITKEEFKIKRLSPLYSIGRKDVKGNIKFKIQPTLDSIIFQPDRYHKYELNICRLKSNYFQLIKQLYELQESRSIPITYKLDQNYIYISFDESKLNLYEEQPFIKNRILGIDMNPNYIGCSIVDWLDEDKFNIIDKKVYSLKPLSDEYKKLKEQKLKSNDPLKIHLANKRTSESILMAKQIITLARHYKVESIALEDLNIKSKDLDKGKNYNYLINNQWIRKDFINVLKKYCNLFKIKLIEVKPEYSSFIGNVLFNHLKLPDMVLSSIEISRRGYEFNLQYKLKEKEIKKNIIFPDFKLFNMFINKTLADLNINMKFKKWIDLYDYIKKSDIRYRVTLDQLNIDQRFRKRHLKFETIL